jgi:hypothetical protein
MENTCQSSERRDELILDIRAYDEGIAFRYHFPGGQYLKITDEYTEYTMPEGTKPILPLKLRPRILICLLKTGRASRTVHCC